MIAPLECSMSKLEACGRLNNDGKGCPMTIKLAIEKDMPWVNEQYKKTTFLQTHWIL